MDNQSTKPRLLVLTSTFPRWKEDVLPPFVLQLCRQLQSTFEIHVLAPHTPRAERRETIAGMQVTRFRYFWPAYQHLAYGSGIMGNLRKSPALCLLVPFFVAAQFFSVLMYLRRFDIAAIHAHWLIPQGLIAAFARILLRNRVGLVCTAHGSDLFALEGTFFTSLRRWVGSKVDAVSVVSTSMAETLSAGGVDRTIIHVIPMGVDLYRKFTPSGEQREPFTVLYVGRLVEQKSVHDLIAAMQKVRTYIPDARIWIVGDGSDRRRLEFQAGRSLGESFHFFGAVSHREIVQLYRRASVLAFPSRRAEGFGLVIVEAMGCECPVIASDIPGVRDIVAPGKTGLVFPPGNTDALAEQLVNALRNPNLRLRMAQRARCHVLQHFDWQVIGMRYQQLLKELVRI